MSESMVGKTVMMGDNLRDRFQAMIGASFDPLTNGHVWMIQQAAKYFNLHLALAVNPDKKYTFSQQEREDMLSETLVKVLGKGRASEVKIHLIPDEYLAEFAAVRGINLLVRGLRDADDYKYERRYRLANAQIAPKVDTFYVMPPLELEVVSSSYVKNWIGPKGWEKQIYGFVPACVYIQLIHKNGGKFLCTQCWKELTPTERKDMITNGGGWCEKCAGGFRNMMANR